MVLRARWRDLSVVHLVADFVAMPITELQFKPGIQKNGTDYASKGGWSDCNLVRFRDGYPKTIGGWSKFISSTYTGTARSMKEWAALDGNPYLAVATNQKLYVANGGVYYDITPIRRTVTLGTDALESTTAGSGVVVVTDTLHGATLGDYVTISGATAFDDLTTGQLNKEHVITEIVDANTYKIDTGGAATAGSTAGGGASISAAYQVNVGQDTQVIGVGYGSGTYGRNTWGSDVTSELFNRDLRLWSLDNYGEDLLCNPRYGGIYYWDKSVGTGTRAVNVKDMTGANSVPTSCMQVMVSDQDRHVIAFGANPFDSAEADPLLVRWSDAEDVTNWYPDTDNSAGDYRLSSGSMFIGAFKTNRGILIWTDSALYLMQFTGAPYYFSFTQIADGLSICGPAAAASAGGYTFWMDLRNFYVYGGSVDAMQPSVWEHVFESINLTQRGKIFAWPNPAHNEVWWFYPSAGQNENDRYVAFNYKENIWYIGYLARTAGLYSYYNTFPIAAGTDGYLYRHEFGQDADGSAMSPYIQSADFDVDSGENMSFMRAYIPDIRFTGPGSGQAATVTIKTRKSPGGDQFSDASAHVRSAIALITGATQRVPLRARGRQVAMRVESNQLGTGWLVGLQRLHIQPDGKK